MTASILATILADTLNDSLAVARQVGLDWSKELIEDAHGDASLVLGSIDRDPECWWQFYCYDAVKDHVTAQIWADHRWSLMAETAKTAAEQVRTHVRMGW